MYELPDFLRNPRPVPEELREKFDRWNGLEEEYFEKFRDAKDNDWDSWSNEISEDELIEALEECLEKGKPMREVRPQWCGNIPKNLKT